MVISCILQQEFLVTSESAGLASERGQNNRRKTGIKPQRKLVKGVRIPVGKLELNTKGSW